MICVLLALQKTPPSDAADALGVAVCHGHHRETRVRMAALQRMPGGVAS